MRFIFLFFILLPFHRAQAHSFLVDMIDQTPQFQIDRSSDVVQQFTLNSGYLQREFIRRSIRQRFLHSIAEQAGNKNIEPQDDICHPIVSSLRNCGVFDHFSQVRSIAIEVCDALTTKEAVAMIPEFTGPASFVDYYGSAVTNHHDFYAFDEGITFNCVKVLYIE